MTDSADVRTPDDRKPRRLERVMFRQVEFWIIGLVMIVGFILTIGFGIVVRSRALGHDRFGVVGDIAYGIASIPATIRTAFNDYNRLLAIRGGNRFAGRSGWHIASPSAVRGLAGYMLLSRADGDTGRHVVDLVDLHSFQTVYTWHPDAEKLFGEFPRCATCEVALSNAAFRVIEPYAYANGDLLLRDHYSALARVSPCGERVWANATVLHHSTELDASGDIWSPSLMRERGQPPVQNRPDDYLDDSIAHVSADGRLIEKFDLTNILNENGFKYLLVGMTALYHKDPIHLNDVEPILSDGTYWKKGDLLLSMRHKSTLALFRPSTGKILWLKSGPWLAQHDVDVIGDGKISVFDNRINREVQAPSPGDTNRVLVYDFATGTVTSPYEDIFRELDFRTETEGLQQALPSGYLMAEETNFGRLVIIGPDGKLAAEYINGAKDGRSYLLGWSRYVPKALGDQIAEATRNLQCGS